MNLFSVLIKFFIVLLLLIHPFGNLLRIPHPLLQADVFGLQTLVAGLVIIIGLFSQDLIKGFKKNQSLIAYVIFIIIGTFLSYFEPIQSNMGLRSFLQSIYYLILAVIISNVRLSPRDLLLGSLFYSVGFGFISALSLLDYYHILSLDGFNVAVGSRTIEGEFTEKVRNLSGPFHTRTTFGNYCGLAIGTSIGTLFMGALMKKNWMVFLSFGLISINFVVALASLSRGLVLSFILAFIYLYYLNAKKFKKSLSFLFPIFGLGLLIGGILMFFNNYYLILLNFISSLNIIEAKNDVSSSFRFIAWRETFMDIKVWIIGRGFTLVYIPEFRDFVDAHNTFVTLFRVCGLPGVVLLYIAFRKVISFSFHCINPLAIPYLVGVFSYLGYGLTHTAWNFSVFWIFIGVVFNIKNYYSSPHQNNYRF
jgi:hypothetical protein